MLRRPFLQHRGGSVEARGFSTSSDEEAFFLASFQAFRHGLFAVDQLMTFKLYENLAEDCWERHREQHGGHDSGRRASRQDCRSCAEEEGHLGRDPDVPGDEEGSGSVESGHSEDDRGKRNGSAADAFKKEYGKDSVPAGYDVDHVIDLQLGSADHVSNMRPLDASVNRSMGAQIRYPIKDLPEGTKSAT